VIFETGIALGIQPGKTILAALGVNVRLFSDLYGFHVVALEQPDGKHKLLKRLQQIQHGLPDPAAGWERNEVSGDFGACAKRRWTPYDELTELEDRLARVKAKDEVPVLEVVKAVLAKHADIDWRHAPTGAFCEFAEALYGKAIADDAYYWLVEHGFFWFDKHDDYFSNQGKTWRESVEFSAFAERGLRLIERLRCLPAR
jgi:hypothetical protein